MPDNPKIWGGSGVRTLRAVTGHSSGGLCGANKTLPYYHDSIATLAYTRAMEYLVGVVYGELYHYYIPGQWGQSTLAQFEQWMPDEYLNDAIQSLPFRAAMKYEDNTYPTLLVPLASGSAYPYRWSQSAGNPGFERGIAMDIRASWDPRLQVITGPLYQDKHGAWHATWKIQDTSRDYYTWEQFPYGGTPLRTPRRVNPPSDMASTPEAFRTGTRPCWLIGFNTHPLRSDVFFFKSIAPGVAFDAMAWFMPDDALHYPAYYVEQWNTQHEAIRKPAAKYFMGCVMAGDQSSARHYAMNPLWPDFNIEPFLRGKYYNNIPAAWNPTYPNNDTTTKHPDRVLVGSETLPQGDRTFRECSLLAGPRRAPHIKVGADFMLPFVEFVRPLWMDSVPSGTDVVSATAEVKVTGCKRFEYQAEIWDWPKEAGPPSYTQETSHPLHVHLPGCRRVFEYPYSGPVPAKYGWIVKEKSKAGPQGDSEEEWKTIHKVTESVGANGTTVDSDNTHVHYRSYEYQVKQTTGILPVVNSSPDPSDYWGPPKYIPKSTPWYSPPVGGPQSVTPLTGVKLAHALVGLQQWGHMTGQTEEDLHVFRTLKEMERPLLWHPTGQTYNGFQPNGSYYFYPFEDVLANGEDAYLQWLRSKNTSAIPGLYNYRYRLMTASRCNHNTPEGWTKTIPPDTWATVNLKEIFEFVLADKGTSTTTPYGQAFTRQHQKYRIYPCLPHFAEGTIGVQRNIAMLYQLMMPNTIHGPTDTSTNPVEFHKYFWDEIVYQHFDTWQIRAITVHARTPGGRDIRFRIRTPWDAS